MARANGVHADVEFLDSEQVRLAIEDDFVVGPAVPLPGSAQRQVSAGDYVYVPGYTARGPVCVSWGRRQQMSWTLPDEYYGEPCAVAEETDSLTATIYEEARMNAFLARIPADC